MPLELQQFPAGLELTGEAPATVDVRVRGASGTLSRVSHGRHRRGARPAECRASGRRLFQLTPEQVRVPFGVEVVQVTPSAVAMAFEPSASRQVPVVPAVDGRPAPGYVVGAMTRGSHDGRDDRPGKRRQARDRGADRAGFGAGARDRVTQSVILGLLDPSLR